MTAEPPRTGPPSSPLVVGLVAVVAAVGAALTEASPTGTRAADAVWCALTAALVAVAGSRARRAPLLWFTAISALVAVRGEPIVAVLGVAALVGAIALIGIEPLSGRADVRAVVAGAAVVALIGAPGYGFTALPTVVGCVAVAPVLFSAWRSCGRSWRWRWAIGAVALVGVLGVVSVLANVSALQVRDDLSDASDQAYKGLRFVRQGDVDSAEPLLDASHQAFADSASTLNGPLALLGRFVPVVGHQVDAVRQLSDAGAELTGTAVDAARLADPNQLRTSDGAIDLAAVQAMQAPADAALDAAEHTRSVIDEVRSPWLIQPISSKLDDLEDELDASLPSVQTAADALRLAPQLLGADGPRRYLLQLGTPGESRGAGGYIGGYGVLVASGGRLDLESTGSTEDLWVPLDQPSRPFEAPPGWQERYATYDVGRYPGNVSADPDWPTDSEVARQIYAQVPEVGEIDGTLYADPTALSAILGLTGPVEVTDIPVPTTLTAENVERYLLIDQYELYNSDVEAGNAARRDALAQVTSAVFDAFTSRELPGLRDMVDALGPVVAGGHLKVVAFDPDATELLDTTGLSGAWDPSPGADYLSVRVTDLLANKIEVYLERTLDVAVVHDPVTGAVRTDLTITLTNTSPTTGLPYYVNGNYDDLPIGTNRSEISIYSPLAVQGATLDDTPIGLGRHDYGTGSVYGFPVQLAPGQTRTLRLQLEGQAPALPYRLEVIPQPLATPDRLRASIDVGGGPVAAFDGPLAEPVTVGAVGVG